MIEVLKVTFCEWGILQNERSELSYPTNKIKSHLTRIILYIYCIDTTKSIT